MSANQHSDIPQIGTSAEPPATSAEGWNPHTNHVIVVQPGPPRGMSIASMVLGLSSIVFGFLFVVPLVAVILGFVGLRREPTGRGFAIAGIVTGGIILLVWAAIAAFFLLSTFGIIAMGAAGAAGSTGSVR